MPTESTIVRAIIRHLRELPDSWVLKVHGSSFQRRGVPDILFIWHGRSYAFEVKCPGKRLTRIQEVEIERLRKAGVLAVVVHNEVDVIHELMMDPRRAAKTESASGAAGKRSQSPDCARPPILQDERSQQR